MLYRLRVITSLLFWSIVSGSLAYAGSDQSVRLSIIERTLQALTIRVSGAQPNQLYSITYDDGKHHFVWDNLAPGEAGIVTLTDDRHLRPEYRLRCASRLSRADPVVFDDLLKGPISGKRRLPFGVPVSTFGGPGYLVPGVSDLTRDDFGNFWLYLDHPPYAILKYSPEFQYQFALLTPDRILAYDLDAEGRLYILHPGNWISVHDLLGDSVASWELPIGRQPGEFISASGLIVDRAGKVLYLADEILGRVQRFSLDLQLRPLPQTAWGWIGREDLAYTRPGAYSEENTYYQLERPRQLAFDRQGHLFVSCEHYVSKFDLTTGRQVSFGSYPVLGWGGSFTDSAFSSSAALDGHWQRHWLAGVDVSGNVYIADRENYFLANRRLQIFAPDGTLLQSLSLDSELKDKSGQRVYLSGISSLVCGEDSLWLVDAAGRVYQSPGGTGLNNGGRLFLGPGAAGRQFDLSKASEDKFIIELQSARILHRSEGIIRSFPGESGVGNCEREGRTTLANGEQSMWTPARIGEPFKVRLYDEKGMEIAPSQYSLEIEDKPGMFNGSYDYFRVTNRSGSTWKDVHFVAEVVQ